MVNENERIKELENKIAELEKENTELKKNQPELDFLRNSTAAYAKVNHKYKVVDCNRTFLEIFGFNSPEEALGQDMVKRIHPDDMRSVASQFKSDLEHRENTQYLEYRILAANNEYIWIAHRVKARYDNEGKFSGMFGIARDITEKKKAEETLQKSERRFRKLFESLPLPAAIFNFDGSLYQVNTAFEKTAGKSKEELTKNSIYDFIPVEQHEEITSLLAARKSGSIVGPQIYDLNLIIQDTPRQGFISVNKLEGIDKLVMTFQDLTEQKKLEQKLMTSEERFKSLFKNLGVPTFITDYEGHILEVNDVLQERIKSLGTSPLNGIKIQDFIFTIDSKKLDELLQIAEKRVKISPETYEFSTKILDEDHYYLVTANKVSNLDQVILTFQDITERKKLEICLL
jgi:PAS domain S-box-containing protein